MQRHLRRFTHRTDEQTDTNGGNQHPVGTREQHLRQLFALGKHRRIIQRPGKSINQTDTQNEAKVTDTVDQKCLHIGKNSGRTGIPETNQKIRHQTHSFPTKEQLQEVVAHHEH